MTPDEVLELMRGAPSGLERLAQDLVSKHLALSSRVTMLEAALIEIREMIERRGEQKP